jgi:hypothetical protein
MKLVTPIEVSICGVNVGMRVKTKLVGNIERIGATHEAIQEVVKLICNDLHKVKTDIAKNINQVVRALFELNVPPIFPII